MDAVERTGIIRPLQTPEVGLDTCCFVVCSESSGATIPPLPFLKGLSDKDFLPVSAAFILEGVSALIHACVFQREKVCMNSKFLFWRGNSFVGTWTAKKTPNEDSGPQSGEPSKPFALATPDQRAALHRDLSLARTSSGVRMLGS